MPVNPPRSLATKFALGAGTLLVLALAAIGLTLWVTWQLEGGAAAVNEAGRLRMQTWRLVATLHDDSRDETLRRVARFDAGLALLASGDPSRPLIVPWNDESRASFDALQRQWRTLRDDWLQVRPPERAELARQADAFVVAVDAFVTSVEHELARWTAILNAFQLAWLALAIASAVVMMYAGYLFVLDPMTRLREGLRSVEQGDFAARIDVASNDEFGELTAGFNHMAEHLRRLYDSLEDKVREKTAALEVQNERLAALYEVSAFVAKAGTLDELARGFAVQVRRIARADAVAIRWSDEANERYLLLAGDGLPDAMASNETCLLTERCLCGQSRATAGTRVIPIRFAAPPPLAHCAKSGFATLVSVPVMLHDRILGEIDLFFRTAVAPDADERDLLDTLANHLAGSMEGLRAGALEREGAVAEERSLLARELHDSIAQSLAFLRIQLQLLRDALGRRDDAAVALAITELEAGLRESSGDVRELLVHFRTRTNSEDIEPALRTTLQKFEHQTGLRTHLQVEGHGLPLAPDVQVQVLHVVQEALSNVRKHAGAREVWLEVQRAPQWRFEVRDDGRGFDAAADAPDEMHVGLRIMRERAARIGAQVEVDAVPGAGTCVVLTVPPTATPPQQAAAAHA